jgi:hypothetical protein
LGTWRICSRAPAGEGVRRSIVSSKVVIIHPLRPGTSPQLSFTAPTALQLQPVHGPWALLRAATL